MSTAVLTADTPRWLFLALLARVLAVYLGYSALAAIGRARLTRTRGRSRRSVVPARALASPPKEITS